EHRLDREPAQGADGSEHALIIRGLSGSVLPGRAATGNRQIADHQEVLDPDGEVEALQRSAQAGEEFPRRSALSRGRGDGFDLDELTGDRKSTRLNSSH